jgi:hypothetical protein
MPGMFKFIKNMTVKLQFIYSNLVIKIQPDLIFK